MSVEVDNGREIGPVRPTDMGAARDHRRVGKDLQLFLLSDKVGNGLPLWLPAGARIRRELENFIVELEERAGFQHVYTPHIGKLELYQRSGHWQHYHDSLYSPIEIDGQRYLLRPMTCPHHIAVYNSVPRSYRDLPLRIAELGTVYRYEQSGELMGLSRTRGFTVNDAHIFCRSDQVREEFARAVGMIEELYAAVGLREYIYRLSLPDLGHSEKYVDDEAMWAEAIGAITEALESLNVPFIEAPGEAAFYGPKLDIMVRDVQGREFAASTNQIDLYLPRQFDLGYADADGTQQRPVMIHRAPIGSFERFFAHLIEMHGGAFPLWLSPLQAIVIPIGDRHAAYAGSVTERLRGEGLRIEIDRRNERMNARLRDAQLRKVPYMLVVGEREVEGKTVSVRSRTGEVLGPMSIDEVAERLKAEVRERR